MSIGRPVLSTPSPMLLVPTAKVPAERISIPFKSSGKSLKTLNRGVSVLRVKSFHSEQFEKLFLKRRANPMLPGIFGAFRKKNETDSYAESIH